jgi:predicted amidohydrolase
MCLADLNLTTVDRVRAQIPSLEHRVPKAYGP